MFFSKKKFLSTNVVFRPIWPEISATLNFRGRQPPFFSHFRPNIGHFSMKNTPFFFWDPFGPILSPKKFWGSSGHFSPFFGIFGKNNKFSAKFANFWSKLRFLRFFSKFQVEIASRVCVVRRGLRYGKDLKIFELSENFQKKGLQYSPRPKNHN